MNVITVTNENQILYSLSHFFFPAGINVINFKKCSNAISQLNKINPSVIIVDTDTEPRAWKPLVTLIRSVKWDKPIVFLLIMSDCDLDTANQALFLGINGIILKPFSKDKSIAKIIQIIKRHIEIEKNRSYVRIKPSIDDSVIFIYNDQVNRKILKGQIIDISAIGMSVNIKKQDQISLFRQDEKLENAIIKIKGFEIRSDLLFLWCKPPYYGIKFININIKEFDPLYKYLLEKLSFIFELNKGEGDYIFIEMNKLEENIEEISSEEDLKEQLKKVKDYYDNPD
ncbi:MAG: hypothetical protein JXB50_08815 [Spirochaetes bacterium]|nr:hypothetical protein [Spirochaetota bacterium]